METSVTQRWGAALAVLGLGCVWATAAEATRPASSPVPRTAAGARAGTASRGVLPDPVLLDGSRHAAEKKTEYGMIGEFELPGDENAQNGKVGGNSGGEGAQQAGANGGPAMGLPGGGGGQNDAAGKNAAAQVAQKAGGGEDAKGPEKPGGGGAGDPNAQAQGIKVAELGGDPSGAIDPAALSRPAPMAIGDKAMRIPQTQGATTPVVGAQPQVLNQNTQVYEKATGTGGKAPTGVQGPNRTEKGRAIPAGL